MYGFPGDTIYLNNLDVYALCLFQNKVILILNPRNLYNESQCNATHATHTHKNATHAMQNYATCNTTHEMQPMPPILLMQLYGRLGV